MLSTTPLAVRARHVVTTLPALVMIALVAGCNLAPAATPPPTSSTNPTSLATPSSRPAPTPTTASPTSTPSPTLGADLIQHPTGKTDVVLRMEVGGGFVPMGVMLTQAPTFTLYGDGTVIFQPQDNRGHLFGEVAFLPWLVGHLDEDAVQALLDFALTTGRLANAKETYEGGMVTDAPTTVFYLNAGGVEKTVSVYALFEFEQPGPDSADRRGFNQLAEVLRTFENQEELGQVEAYDPELYRVVLQQGFGAPAAEPVDWPWDDLTPDDFPAGDEPGGIANLDREHVAELMEVPTGGHAGVWVLDPDDNPVLFAVRPLLPDEIEGVESVSG